MYHIKRNIAQIKIDILVKQTRKESDIIKAINAAQNSGDVRDHLRRFFDTIDKCNGRRHKC